jgi:hypothetical protein
MTQLLMLNDSPMIWFYLQRKDSNFKRKSEKRICREFLETKFEKKTTTMTVYVRLQEDSYTLKSESVSYPSPSIPTDVVAKTIFKAVTPDIPMLEIFRKLKIPPSFHNVNLARVLLTTSAFPYLTAVG